MKRNTSTEQGISEKHAAWRKFNYDYTDTHDTRDWGWEFIRRNPEYNEEWVAQLEMFKTDKNWREAHIKLFCHLDYPGMASGRKSISKGRDDKGMPILDDREEIDRKIAFYKEHGYNITDPEEDNTFEMFGLNCWSRWGIMNYQNPAAEKLAKCNAFVMASPSCPIFSRRTGAQSIEVEEGVCYARIELFNPLPRQLEMINSFVEVEQQKFKEQHPEAILADNPKWSIPKSKNRWVTYIRLIDALNQGVPKKDAAPDLFTDDDDGKDKVRYAADKWDEALKQASFWVNSGFRELML